MKKISKKILSLFLSLILVATIIPFGAFSASASTDLSYKHTMFDFTFNNGWSDNTSSYYLYNGTKKIYYQSWGNGNRNASDINFSDGVLYSNDIASDFGTSDFANSSYNKNWEITIDYMYYNDSRKTEAYIMKLTNSSTFFGVRKDGQVYYGNSNLGSITLNINSTRYKLTYAYNNGVIGIYLDNNLVFSKDMGSDTFFEGITGIWLLGENNLGTNWYIYRLVAESYQQDSAAAHLKGKFLMNNNYAENIVNPGCTSQ